MRGTWKSKKHQAKTNEHDLVIALAGNPNVGKSTVFNALTGLRQHTGNWPGKTVCNATGNFEYKGESYLVYDLPGTYSLLAHSEEEEVARDFICFGDYDAVVVVCDAVSLERNLNLVLQTIEITPHVIVCVNLLDEAKKKKIHIDLERLSEILGVPVVGTSARSGKGLEELVHEMSKMKESKGTSYKIVYPEVLERAIEIVEKRLQELNLEFVNTRFLALQLIDDDSSIRASIPHMMKKDLLEDEELVRVIQKARGYLYVKGIDHSKLKDEMVGTYVSLAEEIAGEVVTFYHRDYSHRDRKIDFFLTNKWTGIPIMILLLMVIFWLTMNGANYPSDLLFRGFAWLGEYLSAFLTWIGVPSWCESMLVDGVYRTLTWVVSVMLPPMAIFFPLFTLLEDLGYLPRVAFNLDKYFKKCSACGKQALTMCMGFGCNAAGVVGTRIIDSPRERFIAILTNNFVPCNGRFPTIIAIITMFFVGFGSSISDNVIHVFLLTGVILLGIFMTFFISWLLSKTLLKGVPSSFTLELPPYRRPQFGKIIIRSLMDRTLFVLGRAIAIAAPAGLLIWIFANIHVGGSSLLLHCSNFLDPLGRLIGLDGVILMAFLLGFPANEIVIPIMLMTYMATGSMVELQDLEAMRLLLVEHGWTFITAICMILFSLMHFPCSTTCLTIKKETGSWKWTILSFFIPTICGMIICFFFANGIRLIQLFI